MIKANDFRNIYDDSIILPDLKTKISKLANTAFIFNLLIYNTLS